MVSLGFDTATKKLAIGLGKDNAVLETNIFAEKKHSESMFVEIEKLLTKAKVEPENLELVACGVGPGSFIGSRIAAVAAKMFAQVLEIPLIGIPTLDIIAAGNKCENLLVVTDAMRGEIFYAFYKNGKRSTQIKVSKPEVLLKKIENKEYTVTGNAIERYPQIFKGKKQTEVNKWYPSGKSIIDITLERYQKKELDDYLKLVPMYVRDVDAKVSVVECKK